MSMPGKGLCPCVHTCVSRPEWSHAHGAYLLYIWLVGVSAHIFPFYLLTVTPQGLGSLVWVSCVLGRRALMYVWNWGWCVEEFVLEVQ